MQAVLAEAEGDASVCLYAIPTIAEQWRLSQLITALLVAIVELETQTSWRSDAASQPVALDALVLRFQARYGQKASLWKTYLRDIAEVLREVKKAADRHGQSNRSTAPTPASGWFGNLFVIALVGLIGFFVGPFIGILLVSVYCSSVVEESSRGTCGYLIPVAIPIGAAIGAIVGVALGIAVRPFR